jgi:hypothetical protein
MSLDWKQVNVADTAYEKRNYKIESKLADIV